MMAAMVGRWMRTVLEECLKWTHQRLVFGKPLISQPVIRFKLAKMISLVEANQAWLEQTVHQMNHMPYSTQSTHLSGPIGLLKAYATRSAHEIADEATNIFGGRGLTQGGMGSVVEMVSKIDRWNFLAASETFANPIASSSIAHTSLMRFWAERRKC